MNKLLLMLLIVFPIFSASADDVDIGFGYANIDQALHFDPAIEFKMDAAYLELQYWNDSGFGGRLSVMKSTETPNTNYIDGLDYRNKINAGWQFELGYKHDFTDSIEAYASAGITEYHTTWWVNGVEPSWSKGTDSHKPSWTIGLKHTFSESIGYQFAYTYMYEKEKENKGKEETTAFMVGVYFRF